MEYKVEKRKKWENNACRKGLNFFTDHSSEHVKKNGNDSGHDYNGEN